MTDHDQDNEQAHGPLWSASQAAQRTGLSRATMTRRLQAGQIPGATRDSHGHWQITPEALQAAGLDPDAGTTARASSPAQDTQAHRLQVELATEQQRRAVAEALAAERADQVAYLQELLERLTTGMGVNMATDTQQAGQEPAQAPRPARRAQGTTASAASPRKAPPARATTADTPAGQRILQLRDAGQQFSEIAATLTAEGIPTTTGKTNWHRSTVNRIYNRLQQDREQVQDTLAAESPTPETEAKD